MPRHVRRRAGSSGQGPTVASRVTSIEERIIDIAAAIERPEAELAAIERSTVRLRSDFDAFSAEMEKLIDLTIEKMLHSVDRENAAELSTLRRVEDDLINDRETGQQILRSLQRIDAATQNVAAELGVAEGNGYGDY